MDISQSQTKTRIIYGQELIPPCRYPLCLCSEKVNCSYATKTCLPQEAEAVSVGQLAFLACSKSKQCQCLAKNITLTKHNVQHTLN